uniref:Vitellogenin n=1 Tax=Romanomermis culicivorax TaxID=13658 RepID=A0A915K8V0_ROMCU
YHFKFKVREKILIAAFCRSFQDPFAPARIAGVLALTATQQFYTAGDIAQRVMPNLSPLTLDREKQVREPAIRALRGFLDKMEQISENPELATQL